MLISLAPILLLVVAIGLSRAAGEATLAIGASGNGVGVGGTLDTTVTAVLLIAPDGCLASVAGSVVTVLESSFAPRINRTCQKQTQRYLIEGLFKIFRATIETLPVHAPPN